MYRYILKPVFFKFNPETIHHFVFRSLKILCSVPGVRQSLVSLYEVKDKRLHKNILGLNFPSPVGLAAGFDKDGELFNELSCFGFGFIEVGTVTPLAQPGNEKPRMFRLPLDQALINRMGFNNKGAYNLAKNLKSRPSHLIIGGNIGKNKNTSNEEATSDYLKCFEALKNDVDYFVVNVSSPNTPGLRALQEKKPLMDLLNKIQELNYAQDKPKPILLKIAPDLTNEQLLDIIDIIRETKLKGVIATNTTIDRSSLQTGASIVDSIGAGGLSGKPLSKRSTEVIKYLKQHSNNEFVIIGVGGIHTVEDAIEKLEAGADLIQVYTGFIFEGPSIVKKINKGLIDYYEKRSKK